MALIQSDSDSRPVFRTDGFSYSVEFNVDQHPQWLKESEEVPAELQGAQNYTFAFFYMPIGDVTAIAEDQSFPVFGLTVDGGSTSAGAGFAYTGGEFHFTGPSHNPSGAAVRLPEGYFEEGRWYHVCGVREGSSVRLYVDGELVESGTTSQGAMLSDLSDYRVSIGAARDGSRPTPLRGSNLQIWNVALTDEEVAGLAMKRLVDPLPDGLIYYRPL